MTKHADRHAAALELDGLWLRAPTDSRGLRDVLGTFATGVTVVTTAAADGTPVGLTVSSFNAVSLDPPLVLWSLGQDTGCAPAFEQAGHFAVHVLGASGEALSNLFATPDADRFGATPWRRHEACGGVPLLLPSPADAVIGRFVCAVHERVQAGDHTIFIGEVKEAALREGAPLLYARGSYGRLAT